QGDGIAGDGAEHQRQHRLAVDVQAEKRAEHNINDYQATHAGEEKDAAAEAVDGEQSRKREGQIDGAGNDDVEENVGNVVAGGREDGLRVIEDHVDTRPLLQHGQRHAQKEYLAHSSGE